jgi:ADP-ribose pyrophosphatase YjhB (NUDIX family)
MNIFNSKHPIVYCNNCGNEGHVYRQCRLPVLSYGILCINQGNKVLMIRRKDSIAYIEFLRGKYSLDDLPYIQKLLNSCSVNERELLKTLSFDELWTQLWYQTGDKKQTDRMLKEQKDSKLKFEQLKKNTLESLIKKCNIYYETPEWEFPKGRRSSHETNMKCAIREFEEETDLSSEEYILLDNVIPLSEEYVGSNGVRYKHIYYLAFYKGHRELSINSSKYEQFSEIGDIEWLTLEVCSQKIRKEQTTKHTIIQQVTEFIGGWNSDFNLKE